eukprot:15049954-Ditylum_brightwellii.AAC.1
MFAQRIGLPSFQIAVLLDVLGAQYIFVVAAIDTDIFSSTTIIIRFNAVLAPQLYPRVIVYNWDLLPADVASIVCPL